MLGLWERRSGAEKENHRKKEKNAVNRETFIEVATQIFLMAPETAEQYADEAENYGRTYESVLGAFADVVVGNRKRAIRDEFNSDLARACAIGSYTQLVNGGIREQPCNGDVIRAMTNEQLAKWLNTVEFNWHFDDPIINWLVRNWLDQPARNEEWGRFWPW